MKIVPLFEEATSACPHDVFHITGFTPKGNANEFALTSRDELISPKTAKFPFNMPIILSGEELLGNLVEKLHDIKMIKEEMKERIPGFFHKN